MGLDYPTTITPLYSDMMIAAELLHLSHEEFLKLPKLEKKKLRMFLAAKRQKEERRARDLHLIKET